jgi:imidazolonepropionase-like amidohydrolase
MTITPGFIDAHSHVGMSWQELAGDSDTNENTGIINAHLHALDSVDPKDPAFQDAVEGGVTTVMIHPGKLMIGGAGISPIAGQSVVMKTNGTIRNREVLRDPAGIKMAVGDDVAAFLAGRRSGPTSRTGLFSLLRGELIKAREYRDTPGKRDLRMEALRRVLSREIAAHVHVHRAGDIEALLRLAADFEIDIVLEHATEAEPFAATLADRGIPCVVGPITRARTVSGELRNLSQRTPGVLAAAGVKVALMSDHPTEPTQFIPVIAGMAVSEGMDPDDALRAVTINAAEILRIADRVGSIETGKDADLVIQDGDPLEAMTHIQVVIADGQVAVDRRLNGNEARR